MDNIQIDSNDVPESANLSDRLLQSWHRMKYEGDLKHRWLMRLHSFHGDSTISVFFEGYIHAPLLILYLVFIIGMAAIFNKEKLMSFVHHIILVNALVNIIPSILAIPFYLVFYHIANNNAPLPYPWCFLYVILTEYVPKMTFLLSLSLKILLAVNRFCSVYFPFKVKYWFSKSKKRFYVITLLLLFIAVELPINLINFPLEKSLCLDDLWNSGSMKVYTACSMVGFTVNSDNALGTNTFYLNVLIFEIFLFGSGALLFSIINVAFMVKMKRLMSKRKTILESCNKLNHHRLFLLNKIYLWVVLVTLVIDIPQHAMVAVMTMNFLKLIIAPNNFYINKEFTLVQICVTILYKVFLPLDLFIFALLGKKVRTAIRKIICRGYCN